MTFYDAYWFLRTHPKGNFIAALDIDVAMVNPDTRRIDDDKTKNTRMEVWLETGPEQGLHDIMLDCGGESFEEAIIKLAELVKKYYGKRRTKRLEKYVFESERIR